MGISVSDCLSIKFFLRTNIFFQNSEEAQNILNKRDCSADNFTKNYDLILNDDDLFLKEKREEITFLQKEKTHKTLDYINLKNNSYGKNMNFLFFEREHKEIMEAIFFEEKKEISKIDNSVQDNEFAKNLLEIKIRFEKERNVKISDSFYALKELLNILSDMELKNQEIINLKKELKSIKEKRMQLCIKFLDLKKIAINDDIDIFELKKEIHDSISESSKNKKNFLNNVYKNMKEYCNLEICKNELSAELIHERNLLTNFASEIDKLKIKLEEDVNFQSTSSSYK